MKKILFVLFVLLLVVVLTSCSTVPTNPTGTPTPATPPTVAPSNTPGIGIGTPTATQLVTIAGGDFLAIAVDDMGNGWMRIRTAGNRDNCAWSNQFMLTMPATVQAQVPHC